MHDKREAKLELAALDVRHQGNTLRLAKQLEEHTHLESRVTILDQNNKLIVHLGDGGHYKDLRAKPRDAFIPGKFVAPHSAYYDHEGNIFVVEWVEVGRVTKLRRVAA